MSAVHVDVSALVEVIGVDYPPVEPDGLYASREAHSVQSEHVGRGLVVVAL